MKKSQLNNGVHVVTIAKIEEINAKQKLGYSDRTPMVIIKYMDDDGKHFKSYYSLKGYEKNENNKFIIKNGKRIENPRKTQFAKDQFKYSLGYLGACCGFEFERDLSILNVNKLRSKLIGKQVVIEIGHSYNGFLEVKNTVPVRFAEEIKQKIQEDKPKIKVDKLKIKEDKLIIIKYLFLMYTKNPKLKKEDIWYNDTFDKLYDMDISKLQKLKKSVEQKLYSTKNTRFISRR